MVQLLYSGWDRETEALTPWSVLVKASAIYTVGYKHAAIAVSKNQAPPLTFVWKVAGPALCDLKARIRSYGRPGQKPGTGTGQVPVQSRYSLLSIPAIATVMGQQSDSEDELDQDADF